MTSYQRRKKEAENLKKQVEELKSALYQESKIFYSEIKYLGLGHLITGVVVNGQLKEINRQNFGHTNDVAMKIEVLFNK